MSDALDALVNGFHGLDTQLTGEDTAVRADLGRERRKGVPEVIMADRKRPEDCLAAAHAFLDTRGRAILSRVPPALADQIERALPGYHVTHFPASGMLLVKRDDFTPAPRGGRVGILTAGTSDIPTAEEARVIAEEMGCEVIAAFDLGVAGIHRLGPPLRDMLARGVDVLIVAAGMDGALPSVVSGLVDVPVIGLPTPVGYGLGGNGIAALMSMLQTCAPGMTVVNVGNGIGAGASAAMIANRIAAARRVAASEGQRTAASDGQRTATLDAQRAGRSDADRRHTAEVRP
ncbi:MAG: nickel pincer cofactor biosynthesis protein LarB [Chloroflexi bacterium]|nr:nickel pincer cofactor biosynthesis protein LarB [Chloroflexota bacterium]